MSDPFSSMCIGVVGAGTMGAGIAQVAASAGHKVFLYDVAEGLRNRVFPESSVVLKGW